MGKVTGFLEIDRRDRRYVPASDRIRNYKEFMIPLSEEATRDQAARCMDCGIPFCHTGCPVHNQIPDWNDLVYRSDWEEASRNLHSTNNFPEFTGRLCPAPFEASCTLNIDDSPVTIKTIECAIADRAWRNGWIKPEPAEAKTGKKVAVIGSGPAGVYWGHTADKGRARRPYLREKRQARRFAALWHSRLQDGKTSDRPADRPNAGGRRAFPQWRECWDRSRGGGIARTLRRDRSLRRRRSAARSPGSRARSLWRAFRDGIFAAAKPAHRQGADPQQRADPCLGPARHRDRRRRYWIGLHRHRDPPGRAVRDSARNHAASSR